MPTDLLPIPDMRRVQLVHADGVKYVSKSGLCQFCGLTNDCKLKASQAVRWVNKTFQDCTGFQPVLSFRPPLRGFGGAFNTIRLGPAWSRRVQPGTVVTLFNTKAGEIFGRARVTEVHVGTKEEIAAQHGAANHTMLGHDDGENIEAVMLKILRNAFGNLIYQSHSVATVIYLERIDREDGENQEGS